MTEPTDPAYDNEGVRYGEPYTAPMPATAASSQTSRRSWLTGPWAGFAAAILLVVVGVAAYFGYNAVFGDKPFALTGILQLNTDDGIKTGGLPMGYSCAGSGGYADIAPGAPVTVSDEQGTLVATGAIDGSSGEKGSCTLTFKVLNVPGGSQFYKVEVAHRGTMSYNESSAKAGLTLSLGSSDSGPASTAPSPSVVAAPPPPPPVTVTVPNGPAPPRSGPAPAGQGETVPAYSTPCPSNFYSGEFSTSAVGSTVTSCQFAENVRSNYVNQGRRGQYVTVVAYSPVTGQAYSMSCSGNRVVTCTGGNSAVVYLY